MHHNAPNDRLSRLINSVCQVWEEEASETEGKLVTLANRIIADNEHEKMRMQHSFKSMMNMKNSEIGALSQELRKLTFALEQEAKENMENKRKIRALTMEIDGLKGNTTEPTSPLSSCSHLIEDDVSSLHSTNSAGAPHTTADGREPLDLSTHGNNPRQYGTQQQLGQLDHLGKAQGLFTNRSPPQGSGLNLQAPPYLSPNVFHHQGRQGGGFSSSTRDEHTYEPDREIGRGGKGEGMYRRHQTRAAAPSMEPWRDPAYNDGALGFNPSAPGSVSSHEKPINWTGMKYAEHEESLLSILDDRGDPALSLGDKTNSTEAPLSVSHLSLADGPPGFSSGMGGDESGHDHMSPPGFQVEGGLGAPHPPGFGSEVLMAEAAISQGSDDSGVGGADNRGEASDMLNHIRLQSKSSKLDASPVGKR